MALAPPEGSPGGEREGGREGGWEGSLAGVCQQASADSSYLVLTRINQRHASTSSFQRTGPLYTEHGPTHSQGSEGKSFLHGLSSVF